MTILFDMDGTLIDSTEAILESFHRSYDIHGRIHPDDEAIKALIGYPLDLMYTRLGIEEAAAWEMVATYKAHYRDISKQKTVMLPRAVEAIALASRHATLGIVTTKTGRYSQELLEHFGLMHYFSVLIGREHVENPKPHPEPVHKAMEAIATCKRETTWLIGDTRLDLEAANKAGINSVGVLSGYDNLEQLSTLCDIIKNDAFEAVSHIVKSGAKRDVRTPILSD